VCGQELTGDNMEWIVPSVFFHPDLLNRELT